MIELSSAAQEMVNFEDYLKEHEKQEHRQKVKHVSVFIPEALDRLKNGVKAIGDPMPWRKTQDKIRFRMGEVTLWVGQNGNGKSLVMGQAGLWMSRFYKVAIASFEMPADATVARMLRQASGGTNPGDEVLNKFTEELNLYIYDHIGNTTPDTVMGMIHYLAVEKKVRHIMIDSLVKCGVNSEKNEPQKIFLNKLQQAAKEHKIHIHLVHHVRKGNDATETPDKYSVKGAGELVDLADNLIMVSRNMKKVKAAREGSPFDENLPDGYLDILKQRHGEWEGRFAFWWHEDSQQWLEKKDSYYVPLFDNPINNKERIYAM